MRPGPRLQVRHLIGNLGGSVTHANSLPLPLIKHLVQVELVVPRQLFAEKLVELYLETALSGRVDLLDRNWVRPAIVREDDAIISVPVFDALQRQINEMPRLGLHAP